MYAQDDIAPLSAEDRQLLERHGLGLPLRIYRLKKRDLRSFQIKSWIIFFATLLMLFLLILFHSGYWPPVPAFTQETWDEKLQSYGQFCSTGSVFLCGLFGLLIMLPARKRERVLVGEHGLLQIRGILREKREVIHWEEIESLQEHAHTLCLLRREGKPFKIRDDYEGFDALLAQIEASYAAQFSAEGENTVL